MVTLKNIWAQRLNYTKNLKKTLLEVEALGPWSPNTYYMYRGSRIRELVACGLKLDACYSGLDACRLALEELGA
jgi:hypothetical protein